MKWAISANGYYNHDYHNNEKARNEAAVTEISFIIWRESATLRVFLPIGKNNHYSNKNARMLADTLLDKSLGIQEMSSFDMIAPLGDGKFIEFLKIINEHESITCDVYCDLLKNVGCIEEAAIQEMKQLVENGKFDEASVFAEQQQKDKKYEVIWSLATLLAEKFEENLHDDTVSEKLSEKLREVYESISEDNPHFKKANEGLYNLSMNKTFDSEDARAYSLFEAAIKSGNQRLVRYSCGELLGVGMDVPPELTNIQLNLETFVQIAGLYKGQGEEIKGLKEANQQLQQNALAKKDSLTTQSVFKANLAPIPTAAKSAWFGHK